MSTNPSIMVKSLLPIAKEDHLTTFNANIIEKDFLISSDFDISGVIMNQGKNVAPESDMIIQLPILPPPTPFNGKWFTLPIPLLPDTFTLLQWQENCKRIKAQLANTISWPNLIILDRVKSGKFGDRCSLLLVMIKDVYVATSQDAIGATLVDEVGGEISATIHPSIFIELGIKAHFGMGLVLQNVLIFTSPAETLANSLLAENESHLVITRTSFLQLFANIHSV